MSLETDKVKITIIIPIHNSEKYLKGCIQSAQSQTFDEIEILCIDGGSTDASSDIIDELQKKDKRIVYIKDTNTSYGHKLNVGINRAAGEYIAILESDDKMNRNMIKTLYDIAVKYDVDIADADYNAFFLHNDREYEKMIHKYASGEVYDMLLNYNDNISKEIPSCGIWTGLYKKEFLIKENIKLNESKGASFQDTSFLFMTGLLARSCYHVRQPLYQYRVDNVGSSVKDDGKIYEIIGECSFLKDELMKRGIQDREIWRLYYMRKYNVFYWNYCRLSSGSRKLFFERYLEELISDVRNGFISREGFDRALYDCTFLLIDDKDKFEKIVCQRDRKTWAEELNELLDRIENRDVVVFGAGILGKRIIRLMKYNNIAVRAVCDNAVHLHGTQECGICIVSVKSAAEKFYGAAYVIANKKNADEMKGQLIEMGIKETDIAVYG